MLVNLNAILPKARRGRYAVGAFNINNMEIAQGVVAAAIKLHAPVVLQTSEGSLEYAGMEYLAAIARIASQMHKIPIVIHLDHGRDEALVERAIKSGWYSSVMIDASRYPLQKNIRVTRRISDFAHKLGISVEAELGPIFGTEDKVTVSKKASAFTDPTEVKKFVAETKCDALAVSVGTAHGPVKYSRGERPMLDLRRLGLIAAATSVPLVLHGASSVPHDLIVKIHKTCKRIGDCSRLHDAVGVPESKIKKAIKLGVAKVNVDTDMRIAFTAAVRNSFIKNQEVIDPRSYLGDAREAIQKIVERKIKLFGSKI